MRRIAIWTVNAALLVLCGFLAARMVAEVMGASRASASVVAGAPRLAALGPAMSWESRKVILDRNLFRASLETGALEPVAAVETEALEATKLKLALLGTAAADDSGLSRAAVQDLTARQSLVVAVGDWLLGQAEVVRIERKRLVLRRDGQLEELALAEEELPGGPGELARNDVSRRASEARTARDSRRDGARGSTASRTRRAVVPVRQFAGGTRSGGESGGAAGNRGAALPVFAGVGGVGGRSDGSAPTAAAPQVAAAATGSSTNGSGDGAANGGTQPTNPSAASDLADRTVGARVFPAWENGGVVGITVDLAQAGSPFHTAGIGPLDRIVGINGSPTTTQAEVLAGVPLLNSPEPLSLSVLDTTTDTVREVYVE